MKQVGSLKLEVRRKNKYTASILKASSNFQLPTSNSKTLVYRFTAAFTLPLMHSATANACAVCFGNKDSLQTKGTMAGVLFLLILILAVLVSFGVTFVRWGARERALRLAQYGPPSSEPGHS